jgi:ribosomal protein S5
MLMENCLFFQIQFTPNGKQLNLFIFSFEETVLFKKVNSIRVSGGRKESHCSLVLVGNEHGFAGVGFGFASTFKHALLRAKKKAYQDIRSVELTNGTIIQEKIQKKYKKSTVIIYKSTKPGVRAHPVLKKICQV